MHSSLYKRMLAWVLIVTMIIPNVSFAANLDAANGFILSVLFPDNSSVESSIANYTIHIREKDETDTTAYTAIDVSSEIGVNLTELADISDGGNTSGTITDGVTPLNLTIGNEYEAYVSNGDPQFALFDSDVITFTLTYTGEATLAFKGPYLTGNVYEADGTTLLPRDALVYVADSVSSMDLGLVDSGVINLPLYQLPFGGTYDLYVKSNDYAYLDSNHMTVSMDESTLTTNPTIDVSFMMNDVTLSATLISNEDAIDSQVTLFGETWTIPFPPALDTPYNFIHRLYGPIPTANLVDISIQPTDDVGLAGYSSIEDITVQGLREFITQAPAISGTIKLDNTDATALSHVTLLLKDNNGTILETTNSYENGQFYFGSNYGIASGAAALLPGQTYTIDAVASLLETQDVTYDGTAVDNVQLWVEDTSNQSTNEVSIPITVFDAVQQSIMSDGDYWVDENTVSGEGSFSITGGILNCTGPFVTNVRFGVNENDGVSVAAPSPYMKLECRISDLDHTLSVYLNDSETPISGLSVTLNQAVSSQIATVYYDSVNASNIMDNTQTDVYIHAYIDGPDVYAEKSKLQNNGKVAFGTLTPNTTYYLIAMDYSGNFAPSKPKMMMTDEDGNFTSDLGDFILYTPSYEGEILQADGSTAVSSGCIYLYSQASLDVSTLVYRSEVNALGVFKLGGIDNGIYYVEAFDWENQQSVKSTLTIDGDGYHFSPELTVSSDGSNENGSDETPFNQISFFIYSSDGPAINDFRYVLSTNGEFDARSEFYQVDNTNELYLENLPDATYTLYVSSGEQDALSLSEPYVFKIENYQFEDAEGNELLDTNIAIQEGVMAGHVYGWDASGMSYGTVQGASISVIKLDPVGEDDVYLGELITKPDGSYYLPSYGDTYEIRLNTYDMNYAARETKVNLIDASSSYVDLYYYEIQVQGNILDYEGNPMTNSDFKIALYTYDDETSDYEKLFNLERIQNDDGTIGYKMGAELQGTYYLKVTPSDNLEQQGYAASDYIPIVLDDSKQAVDVQFNQAESMVSFKLYTDDTDAAYNEFGFFIQHFDFEGNYIENAEAYANQYENTIRVQSLEDGVYKLFATSYGDDTYSAIQPFSFAVKDGSAYALEDDAYNTPLDMVTLEMLNGFEAGKVWNSGEEAYASQGTIQLYDCSNTLEEPAYILHLAVKPNGSFYVPYLSDTITSYKTYLENLYLNRDEVYIGDECFFDVTENGLNQNHDLYYHDVQLSGDLYLTDEMALEDFEVSVIVRDTSDNEMAFGSLANGGAFGSDDTALSYYLGCLEDGIYTIQCVPIEGYIGGVYTASEKIPFTIMNGIANPSTLNLSLNKGVPMLTFAIQTPDEVPFYSFDYDIFPMCEIDGEIEAYSYDDKVNILSLPDGDYRFLVSSSQQDTYAPSSRFDFSVLNGVALDDDGTALDLNQVATLREGVYGGRVTDPEGTPMSDAHIDLYYMTQEGNEWLGNLKVKPDGSYYLPPYDGTYYLVLYANDDQLNLVGSDGTVAVINGGTEADSTLDLNFNTIQLQGSVTLPSGDGYFDGGYNIQIYTGVDFTTYVEDAMQLWKDGAAYAVGGLPAGAYQLKLFPDDYLKSQGYGEGDSYTFNIDADGYARNLDGALVDVANLQFFNLDTLLTIHVVDEDNQPWKDYNCYVFDLNDEGKNIEFTQFEDTIRLLLADEGAFNIILYPTSDDTKTFSVPLNINSDGFKLTDSDNQLLDDNLTLTIPDGYFAGTVFNVDGEKANMDESLEVSLKNEALGYKYELGSLIPKSDGSIYLPKLVGTYTVSLNVWVDDLFIMNNYVGESNKIEVTESGIEDASKQWRYLPVQARGIIYYDAQTKMETKDYDVEILDADGNYVTNAIKYGWIDDDTNEITRYYKIGNLADGTYQAILYPGETAFNAGYYQSEPYSLTVDNAESAFVEQNLVFRHANAIGVFNVKDGNDETLNDFSLDLYSYDCIDGDWDYLQYGSQLRIFALPEGTYRLLLSSKYEDGLAFSDLYEFTSDGLGQLYDANQEAITAPVDLYLNDGIYAGSVYDDSGNALTQGSVGVSIDTGSGTEWLGSIPIKTDGSYWLPSGTQIYQVTLYPENNLYRGTTEVVKVVDSTITTTVDLYAQRLQVSGGLYDYLGNALNTDDFSIGVYEGDTFISSALLIEGHDPETNDAYYTYEVFGLPEGEYLLRFMPGNSYISTGNAVADDFAFTIDSNEASYEQNLSFKPSEDQLVLEVRDLSGALTMAYYVYIKGAEDNSYHPYEISDDGLGLSFISGLAPGEYKAYAVPFITGGRSENLYFTIDELGQANLEGIQTLSFTDVELTINPIAPEVTLDSVYVYVKRADLTTHSFSSVHEDGKATLGYLLEDDAVVIRMQYYPDDTQDTAYAGALPVYVSDLTLSGMLPGTLDMTLLPTQIILNLGDDTMPYEPIIYNSFGEIVDVAYTQNGQICIGGLTVGESYTLKLYTPMNPVGGIATPISFVASDVVQAFDVSVIDLDASALEALMDNADALASLTDEFTDASLQSLLMHLEAAKHLYGEKAVAQSELDSMVLTLQEAINGLIEKDTVAPIIMLTGASTITVAYGTDYIEPGFAVIDDKTPTDDIAVTVQNTVNTGQVGIYTVTYVATDSQGNSSSKIRTVKVIDNVAPLISITQLDDLALSNANVVIGGNLLVKISSSDVYDDMFSDRTLSTVVKMNGNVILPLADGSYSLPMVKGYNSLSVTSKDVAGNSTVKGVTIYNTSLSLKYSTSELTNSAVTITAELNTAAIPSGFTNLLGTAVILPYSEQSLLENGTTNFNASIPGITTASSDYVATVANIDTTPPAEPVLIALSTTLTNADVYLELEGDEGLQYAIDGGEWIDYDGSITLTDNGSVSSRAIDDAGNTTLGNTIVVDWIDKTAPSFTQDGAPVLLVNGNVYQTNQKIKSGDDLSLTFSAEDNLGGALTAYVKINDSETLSQSFESQMPVTLDLQLPEDSSSNSKVILWIEDEAGNRLISNNLQTVTLAKGFVIDVHAPIVTLNGDATMTLDLMETYSEAGASVYDDLDGNSLVASIAGAVDSSQIGTYILNYSALDYAGNVGNEVSRTVEVVDTLDPVISTDLMDQTVEKSTLIFVASASDNDAVEAVTVLVNNSEVIGTQDVYTVLLNEGINTIVVTASDSSGNEATKTYLVTYTKPNSDQPIILLSTSAMTNQTISVTIEYPEGALVKKYRVNSGEWLDYSQVLTVDSNPVTIEAYAQQTADSAQSTIVKKVVSNYDNIPPSAPVILPSTTLYTNANLTASISGSDALYYMIDQAISNDTAIAQMTPYTGAITVTHNESIYAVAIDAAGNRSAVSNYVITNIDKDAPVVSITYSSKSATKNDVTAVLNSNETVVVTTSDALRYHVFTSNGSYTFTYKDLAGNTGSVTATVTNIDKTVPVIDASSATLNGSVVSAVKGGDVLSVTITAHDQSTLTGTVTLGGYVISQALDVSYNSATSLYTLSGLIKVPTDVNGSAALTATLKDAAGNTTSKTLIAALTIDSTKPIFSVSITNKTTNGYITSPTITTAVINDGSVITFGFDSATINQNISTLESVLNANSVTLQDGNTHALYFRATDAVGNISDLKMLTFKWDATAPAAPSVNFDHEALTNSKVVKLLGYAEGDTISVNQTAGNVTNVIYKGVSSALTEGLTVSLVEGINTITVVTYDQANNASTASSLSITLDVTAPIITLELNEDGDAVTVSTNEPLVNVSYYLDDALQDEPSFTNNRVVLTPAGLTSGDHTLLISGYDSAGNEGSGRLTFFSIVGGETITKELSDGITLAAGTFTETGEFEMNTVEGDAGEGNGFVTEPISFDLSGSSAVDPSKGVILDINVGLGFAENIKLHYYDEENAVWVPLDKDIVNGDSYYNATDSSIIVNVDPSVAEAIAVDNEGEYTILPGHILGLLKHFSGYAVIEDVTAPTLILNTSEPSNPVSQSSISISMTLSESATLTVNGVAEGSARNAGTFNLDFALNEGTNTLSVYATDGAGLSSATETFTVERDMTSPSVTVSLDNGNVHSGNTVTMSALPVSVNATDTNFEAIQINGTMYHGADTSVSLSLSEGANNIQVIAYDTAGNETQINAIVYLDTTAPTISISGVSEGDVIGNDVLEVSISDTSGNSDLDHFVATLESSSVTETYTSDFSFSVPEDENDEYTLTIEAYDAVGNVTLEMISFRLDRSVPTIALTPSTVNSLTNQNVNLSISVTPVDSSIDVKIYKNNVRQTDPTASSAGQYALAFTSDGAYDIEIEAINGSNIANKTLTFEIDKTAPTLTIAGVSNGQSYTSAVTIGFNSSDSVSATLTKDGGAATSIATNYVVNASGSYVLTVTADDGVNTPTVTSYSFTVTISNGSTGSVSIGGGGIGLTPVTTTTSGVAAKETEKYTGTQQKLNFMNNLIQLDLSSAQVSVGTEITVKELDDDFVTASFEMKASGAMTLSMKSRVYAFEASNAFTGTMKITLPIDLKDVQDVNKVTIMLYNEGTKTWKPVGGVVDMTTGTISFETNHFSYYMVAENTLSFDDLAGYLWARPSIETLAARGAISGYPDDCFKPMNQITRAEFASILVNSLNLYEGEQAVSFKDITNQWYQSAVTTAASNGILSGYDGYANPESSITREQMIVMIMNAYCNTLGCSMPEHNDLTFVDSENVSSWAEEAVACGCELGIVSGVGYNQFAPQNNATRAEATMMIFKLLKEVGVLN